MGPPGPVALRTIDQIYGKHKSTLSISDNEALRLGNYFALKSAEMAKTCLSVGVGFGIENPEPWPNSPSLFLLPELITLSNNPLVHTLDFDQCTLGAETAKPTRILYSVIDLSHLGKKV